MAIKKTTPKGIGTKSSPASKGKTSTKKIAVKKSPAKKAASLKKITAPKKRTTVKKATVPKKAGKKTGKIVTGKSIKKLPAKLLNTKNSTVGKIKPLVVKSAIQLLVDAAVEGILEIKGKNISILNLKNIHNRVCDYYIICQADSSTQVNAIAGSVEEIVKKRIGEKPFHTEGFQNSEWILVDYVTVVVHVFQSHIREFYNLEALWADAEVTKIAFD